MRKVSLLYTLEAVACWLVISAATSGARAEDEADDGGHRFQVTVTNLTRGQSFTPILVASHKKGLTLFTLGEPASSQLQTLAETGDTGPLANLLSASPDVKDVITSSGLTNPGQTVTPVVKTGEDFDHISVAAMLIP